MAWFKTSTDTRQWPKHASTAFRIVPFLESRSRIWYFSNVMSVLSHTAWTQCTCLKITAAVHLCTWGRNMRSCCKYQWCCKSALSSNDATSSTPAQQYRKEALLFFPLIKKIWDNTTVPRSIFLHLRNLFYSLAVMQLLEKWRGFGVTKGVFTAATGTNKGPQQRRLTTDLIFRHSCQVCFRTCGWTAVKIFR